MTDSGQIESEQIELTGRSLHPGRADAPLIRLEQPLSFWGGVDATGTVVEARHPQYGIRLAGAVVAMPTGRGSSSSTAVLAELIRAGTAPAGLLLAERDTILVTGALVAAEIYGRWMPIVELTDSDFSRLATGRAVSLTAGLAPAPVQVRVNSWTGTSERIRS